jgi:hypothetical protein
MTHIPGIGLCFPSVSLLVIVCSGGRVFMDKALPALGDPGGGYRYVTVLCSSS